MRSVDPLNFHKLSDDEKTKRTFGQWRIEPGGCLYCKDEDYLIEERHLTEDDWLNQMTRKMWCNLGDFYLAYKAALAIKGIKKMTIRFNFESDLDTRLQVYDEKGGFNYRTPLISELKVGLKYEYTSPYYPGIWVEETMKHVDELKWANNSGHGMTYDGRSHFYNKDGSLVNIRVKR